MQTIEERIVEEGRDTARAYRALRDVGMCDEAVARMNTGLHRQIRLAGIERDVIEAGVDPGNIFKRTIVIPRDTVAWYTVGE